MKEADLPAFQNPDWKSPPLVLEIGWEVCQQLGGIYTVLRSKAPSMVARYDTDYCLLGPYNADTAPIEFEERSVEKTAFAAAAAALRAAGISAKFGQWLVPGRPKAVLLDIESARSRMAEIKYVLWEKHGVQTGDEKLVDDVLLFGDLVVHFVVALLGTAPGRPIVTHFHEWMGGAALPEIRRLNIPVTTVFTTHATILGRYIATGDARFYDNLPRVNAFAEAKRFDIESKFLIERAAAHGAHVFTTLSNPTAMECRYLIGREPDLLLPNGIHVERPVAIHEYENLHQKYKANINRFIMGYFFPSYVFDLENTLYFFTSGRYEYRNKGFDVTVEALARLNHRMRVEKIDKTVVAFFVTRKPFRSIHPEILSSMALLEELQRTCEGIKDQIGERLFLDVAKGKKPWLAELVDEYWWIRLRRGTHAWKSSRLPPIISHIPLDDSNDELLNQLRICKLHNHKDDPVKVVYHPDFISTTSPLFQMEYDQFVRGCHLGVFPSYYEPWGYTPLECLAHGIPAVTSDLAGFGSYVGEHITNYEDCGLHLVPRRSGDFNAAAQDLADSLHKFTLLDRRGRIAVRSRAESLTVQFDWMKLSEQYRRAHMLALQRADSF